MRILVDGKPVDSLDAKIARRMRLSPDRPPIEGVVMSADQFVTASLRDAKLALGIVAGVGAAIVIVVLIGVLVSRAPEGAFLLPVDIVVLAAIGAMWAFAPRRIEAKARDDAPRRLARMAPPGTVFRLEAAGLASAGRVTPWSDIAIEMVEIVAQPVSEGPDDYLVDALLLNVEGRTVVLDSKVLTNGRAIVDKAQRALDATRQGTREKPAPLKMIITALVSLLALSTTVLAAQPPVRQACNVVVDITDTGGVAPPPSPSEQGSRRPPLG